MYNIHNVASVCLELFTLVCVTIFVILCEFSGVSSITEGICLGWKAVGRQQLNRNNYSVCIFIVIIFVQLKAVKGLDCLD